jgi:hypothetical protein
MKPITSRIKRSPLFSYGESPAKQTAKGGSTTKTDDKEIIEKKEVRTQASKDFEAKCYNADGSRKKGVAGCTWADEEGTESPKETEIVETKKTIPGEEKDVEFDVMKMRSQGTMLEPWEAKRQRRLSDQANREIYKAQRKMARYGSFSVGEDGKKTFKPNEGLSQKELRRLEKAQSELEIGRNLQTNARTGTKKGVRAGDKFDRGQRKELLGERTEDQQKAQAERTARIEARRAEDEASGKSSGQAGGAVEVGAVNPFAGIGNFNVAPLSTGNINYMDLLNSPANMNKKGYNQKAKSPVAKALKGNQNKLPQHLQDAIKAAPGKMKTPMKKGYFKGM